MSQEENENPSTETVTQNEPLTRGQKLELKRLAKKELKASRKGDDAEKIEEQANQFLAKNIEKIEGWFAKKKKAILVSGASIFIVLFGTILTTSIDSSSSEETSNQLWSAIQTARAPIVEEQDEIASGEEAQEALETYASNAARSERALVNLREAQKSNPDSKASSWASLAESVSFQSTGEHEKALEALNNVLDQKNISNGISNSAQIQKAHILIAQNKFNEAEKIASNFKSNASSINTGLILEGKIHFAKGETEKAKEVFTTLWDSLKEDETPANVFSKKQISTYLAVVNPAALADEVSKPSSVDIQRLMQQMNSQNAAP